MCVRAEVSNLSNATTDVVGCRYPDEAWCITVPKIYIFQYAIALLLIAIGYPVASVMCYSIYSKILGPNKQVYINYSAFSISLPLALLHRQGTMMGVLTAAGSLARALGPIFVSTLYVHTGPQVTFSCAVAVVAASIVFMAVFYYRLVPRSSRPGCV